LKAIAFDGFPKWFAGSEHILLADELVKGCRPHALGQRRSRSRRRDGCVVVGIVEEAHRVRCRKASYNTNAAATPTFSDSTGNRMGIDTRRPAVCSSASGRPGPSPPNSSAVGLRKS